MIFKIKNINNNGFKYKDDTILYYKDADNNERNKIQIRLRQRYETDKLVYFEILFDCI